MATANIYTFSKRKNSTLLPTFAPVVIDVQLKSGTSLISPTFLLNNSGRPSFNYINFEGRYYFVNDITSVRNDLWEIACTEDFLATWKTDIGSSTALILNATGGSNDIIDTRIPVKDSQIIRSNTAALSGMTILDSTLGVVILSVTGVGSFGVYVMEDSTLINTMLDGVDNWWDSLSIASVETALQQFIYGGSAGDCIKSAIALPFLFPVSGFPTEQLVLGKYPTGLNGHRVTNPIARATVEIDIPWQYTDWRRCEPYSKVYLYLPFIGTIKLNATELKNDRGLTIMYALNVTSGDLSVEIGTINSGRILSTCSTNVAMAVNIGSSNVSGGKITQAVATGAGAIAAVAAGAISGGAATVALGGGLASSAGQLLSALQGEMSGAGGLGGGSSQGLSKVVRCTTVSGELTDSQSNLNSIIGKPVMRKSSVGSFSGYVQTDGMEVAGNMLDQEREAINNLCNGGIYYE